MRFIFKRNISLHRKIKLTKKSRIVKKKIFEGKMKRFKNGVGKIFRKKKSVSTQTDLAVVDGEKMNITSVQLGKIFAQMPISDWFLRLNRRFDWLRLYYT